MRDKDELNHTYLQHRQSIREHNGTFIEHEKTVGIDIVTQWCAEQQSGQE